MKLFSILIIHVLLFGLFGSSACSFAHLASNHSVSAPPTENQAPKADADKSAVSNQAEREETDAAEVEGTYVLNNYRDGKGGYVNSLFVTRADKGKISVSYEGTYFYDANGAETFHNTEAEGNLTLKGNVASGKLIEGGSENGCAVELNFAGERVNLKSSNCDLNVTPDGVYKRGSLESDDSDNSKRAEKPRRNPENQDAPFIQYDSAGAPNGIVNLMEHEGEREGCGEEVLSFTGKAITVEENGDFDFEFTLVNGNRKRQKFSLVFAAEDRLPFDDLRSIIKTGNNLEVIYINCGNAPIATPTAVYKQ